MPQDQGLPRVRQQHGGQHPDERRLAGPVRTEQTKDRAALHDEVDPVDRHDVAEASGESLRRHRRCGRAGSSDGHVSAR